MEKSARVDMKEGKGSVDILKQHIPVLIAYFHILKSQNDPSKASHVEMHLDRITGYSRVSLGVIKGIFDQIEEFTTFKGTLKKIAEEMRPILYYFEVEGIILKAEDDNVPIEIDYSEFEKALDNINQIFARFDQDVIKLELKEQSYID